MAERRKLGRILLDAGAIKPDQLKAALEDQKRYGGRLGTILLERRFIDEKTFFRALSSQLKIPAVDFSRSVIPEAVIRLLPQELAEKYLVFPVATRRTMSGNAIVLAMADPTNVEAQDEIQFRTGYRIEPCLALESTIREIHREYYYEQEGKGSYHYKPDIELGLGKAEEEEEPDIMRGSSRYQNEAPEIIMERDRQIDMEEESGKKESTASRSPQLTRELKALLRLLAKKGIISQKEYLDEFEET
jgi:hypothetical protein